MSPLLPAAPPSLTPPSSLAPPLMPAVSVAPLPDPGARPVPVGAGLVHEPRPGVSRHWLESMRRDGLLVAVGPDCYLLAEAADWPTARRLALARMLPAEAVVTLATAVWAHGGPEPMRGPGQPIPVEIAIDPHLAHAARPGIRVTRTRLPAEHVEQLNGVRVTTAVRTLTDLMLVGRPHHDGALQWLLHQPEVSVQAAREVLEQRGSIRHLRRAHRIIDLLENGYPDPLGEVSRHEGTAEISCGDRRSFG